MVTPQPPSGEGPTSPPSPSDSPTPPSPGRHRHERPRRIRRALWNAIAPLLTNPYDDPFANVQPEPQPIGASIPEEISAGPPVDPSSTLVKEPPPEELPRSQTSPAPGPDSLLAAPPELQSVEPPLTEDISLSTRPAPSATFLPEAQPAAPPPTTATSHTRLTAVGPSGIEGVPAPYDDGTEWLRNGLVRHINGTWVGLITGWTGIWIALWGAAIGLIFGALIAGGIATGLGSGLGVGQATGVLGILAGGALGLIAGFLGVLYFLFVARPLQAILSVVAGALLGIVIVLIAAAFERLGLRLRGYRRLSRAEVRRVAPLVKDAAEAMGLPALPRFAMTDILTPNAWTHMRTVVITTGLLQTLTDEELRAVLAHELEHWRMGDAVGQHFVWAAAWPVALSYNLGMLLAGQRHPGESRRGVIGGVLALAGWAIAWPASVIIKLIITPVVASSQRRYEYAADAAASKIGYAADLSSALRKMGAFESGRTGWEEAMAATHPPTELRLEALEPPQPDDFEYQEDELRGPSRNELGRLLRPWRRSRRVTVEGSRTAI